MRNRITSQFFALVALGMLVGSDSSKAADVFVGSLEPATSGGIKAASEQKLVLSSDKPANVTSEPVFGYTPQYGTITLGNGKNNKIAVAVDTDGLTLRPKLFVDVSGTGDLRTPVPFTVASTGPGRPTFTASVVVNAHYDVAGRGGNIPSTLTFTLHGTDLTYNREYARVGKLTVGSKTYRVALVDETVDGRFDQFKHDDGEPGRVSLYIDRLNKGQFDPKKDRFDAGKPFRFAGSTFEVVSIDPRGTLLSLKSSSKSAGVSASSLHAGSDVIEFEVETVDGKTLHFPDDFKGKVVMLDFWAMWCQPCLMEMPNVISVYKEYHKQGFEILGVSLDQANKKNALVQFVSKYDMGWQQVYDGGYWKAEIAQLYEVNAIPHAILVDGTTGKIVALGDDIRGAALAPAVDAALKARQ